jgi:hypothetical protein
MCRQIPIPKKGVLYNNIRNQLRPFDVLLFKGNTLFSKSISVFEHYGNKFPNSGEFSHSGIIVTSEVLNRKNIFPGKIYILESTFGGYLGHNIKDVDNRTIIGVQIRDLDLVIPESDKPNDTIIACGKLIHNPIDEIPIEEIREIFSDFCNEHIGETYDANPYDLLSSIFPCMRKYREEIDELCHTQNWIFCSELVAMVYKRFGVYPPNINPKDVVPRDIIYPWMDTDEMPKIINELIYITTPLHQILNKCKKNQLKL